MSLDPTKYSNNSRTVTSGAFDVTPDDSIILVNTTFDPSTILHTATIDLNTIPAGYWSTQYKLYVVDIGGFAATYPITIIAPTGFLINGQQLITINTNGGGVLIRILNDTNYIGTYNNGTLTGAIPVKNTVYVMKNGNDASGLVERFDKPFLTIAGARAAVAAFYTAGNAPCNKNRILIYVYSGNYLEPIILDNFVDYSLGDSTFNNTVSGRSIITDNNIAVESIIYGQANLTSQTTGATTTIAVNIQNSLSNVVLSFNNLTMTEASTATLRGVLSVGTLSVNFNNISVTATSGNTIGIFASGGTIYAKAAGDIATSTTGDQNAITSIGSKGILYFEGNNITANGSLNPMNTISAQIGGSAWVKCNNIYHKNAGNGCINSSAISCSNGDSNYLSVICNEIIVTPAFGAPTAANIACCQIGASGSASTTNSTLIVVCNKATMFSTSTTHFAIQAQKNDVSNTATFKGKYVVNDNHAGLNNNCVSISSGVGVDSLANLIFDGATLIANGTGESIKATAAKNVTIYGSCQANLAADVNITLLVGTVANGRYLVDVNAV